MKIMKCHYTCNFVLYFYHFYINNNFIITCNMNTLLSLAPTQLKNFYNNFIQTKIKGKQNIILEPLQVMVQLSLLSFCPIGTKITINNNILSLQPPTIVQPINRWFNYDKKDDIYHLFQVIKRFIKWYNNSNSIISNTFYTMMVEQSKKGLDNLIKTYQNCEMLTIIPVLNMYKDLLNTYDINKVHPEEKAETIEISEINKNIDMIFFNISTIYSKEIIDVLFYMLQLLKKESDTNIIDNYIHGINIILQNINNKITTWINDNLII